MLRQHADLVRMHVRVAVPQSGKPERKTNCTTITLSHERRCASHGDGTEKIRRHHDAASPDVVTQLCHHLGVVSIDDAANEHSRTVSCRLCVYTR